MPPDVAPPFLDLNGDDLSSDFDGKKVLEDLNASGSRLLPEPRLDLPQPVPPLGHGLLVRLRLETVNAAGQVVSTVDQGETFFLNVYAADLRPAGTGVFSAYLDVAYDQAALAAAGPIQFGASFPNVRAGSTATPGLLDEAGAVRPAATDGVSERCCCGALTATAGGNVTIPANPADVLPAGQVTLYGIDGPIPADKIEYGTVQVTVVRVDSDGDGVTDFEEDARPTAATATRTGRRTGCRATSPPCAVRQNDPYVTIAAAPQVTLTNVIAVANPRRAPARPTWASRSVSSALTPAAWRRAGRPRSPSMPRPGRSSTPITATAPRRTTPPRIGIPSCSTGSRAPRSWPIGSSCAWPTGSGATGIRRRPASRSDRAEPVSRRRLGRIRRILST